MNQHERCSFNVLLSCRARKHSENKPTRQKVMSQRKKKVKLTKNFTNTKVTKQIRNLQAYTKTCTKISTKVISHPKCKSNINKKKTIQVCTQTNHTQDITHRSYHKINNTSQKPQHKHKNSNTNPKKLNVLPMSI